jgi:hypothetical protein
MKEQKSNASDKSVQSPILRETSHNSNQSQKDIEQQIEVPSSTPHYPQPPYPPTTYDYLALAPALLVAATPLVLGWLDRRNRNENKED